MKNKKKISTDISIRVLAYESLIVCPVGVKPFSTRIFNPTSVVKATFIHQHDPREVNRQ